ncbi:hypothetical protein GGP72_001117 [Salinibacter ruber]|uniref:Uncharacterized protein n=1 Tax=Salinibacter ruber TaxID=146919 RepID=A0A9X2Q2S5_9BACT|nr:hypothetical protein [Salinibacter ruber]MCS3677200.1 hypothetical protein [Salinibacter ruber]MCS3680488.1 hypothetical protein [Salinibacter ruber]
MTVAERTLRRGSLLIVLLAASVAWTSCDLASASNTAILNAGFDIPPTVRHRFEYAEGEISEAGQVEMLSTIASARDLDDVLSENLGASRSDVVDARIDSVQIKRINGPSLKSATLFLGTSDGGARVASVEFSSDGASFVVDDTSTPVLEAVRNDEARTLYGRFELESAGDGAVRATVYYRLEVEGV